MYRHAVLRIQGGRGLVRLDRVVELVQLLEELTLPRPRDRVRGVRANEGIVHEQGGFRAADPGEDERLVVQRVRIARLDGQRPVVRDERLPELPELGVRVAEVVRGDLVRRVEAQRAAVRLDRVLVPAEAVERDAAVVPEDAVLVPEGDRALVAIEGDRELARVGVRVAPEELRLPSGEVLRRREGRQGEGQGKGHRGRISPGADLRVPRSRSGMRASVDSGRRL